MKTGKVWHDAREKNRRNRFHAWYECRNGFLPIIECKKFPTRRAASDWLKQRGVQHPKQY